jgi:hypothetical protein
LHTAGFATLSAAIMPPAPGRVFNTTCGLSSDDIKIGGGVIMQIHRVLAGVAAQPAA